MTPKSQFTPKRIFFYITYAILLFLALTHLSTVKNALSWLLAVLQPVLFGLIIAFILNLFMELFRRKLFYRLEQAKSPVLQKLCTPLCVLFTILFLIGFILLIVFLIIPQVYTAITTLIEKIPQSALHLKEVAVDKMTAWGISESIVARVSSFSFDWNQIVTFVSGALDGEFQTFLDGAVSATTSVISTITNFVLGIIIAIYLLIVMRNEKFRESVHIGIQMVLPSRYHDQFFKILHLANQYCSNFVTGLLTEALLIGVLCTIGLSICKFPFAAAIGVLTGITTLIPIIGAWIGGAIGLLLVWVDSPDRAIWFLVFIFVLQMLESQFIYPKVVGDSLGLPGLIVLLSVILGTSFGGVIGIFIAVPLSGMIYALIKESIENKRQQNEAIKQQDESNNQDVSSDEGSAVCQEVETTERSEVDAS